MDLMSQLENGIVQTAMSGKEFDAAIIMLPPNTDALWTRRLFHRIQERTGRPLGSMRDRVLFDHAGVQTEFDGRLSLNGWYTEIQIDIRRKPRSGYIPTIHREGFVTFKNSAYSDAVYYAGLNAEQSKRSPPPIDHDDYVIASIEGYNAPEGVLNLNESLAIDLAPRRILERITGGNLPWFGVLVNP